ncbi:hypothetical protein [Mesoterricola silvestris]|uniref:Uncharacterized protein n=1 Tax=Mesoterricola silvestris TaxID=2927979 RepID=A0AA48GNS1_9BACT|nr:hypothetical protein [Mesoterricola silvestris]BDU71400.1 hypothetical protein METEAL_05740 [Mesoterricola silvestris]
MISIKAALMALCTAGALSAQGAVDLNGLASAAKRFASQGLQGTHSPADLDLRLVRGDNGGNPAYLMSRAADVQRWTLFYEARYPVPEEAVAPAPRPRSASVKCTKGLFSDFLLSKSSIPACKSMENTWVAVNLDSAIAGLNANGYVRGFSQVETKRPDAPGYPDELVYVFTCPWERAKVAISGNTGALAWYQMY